ncbi:MAG: MFS transporter, partial [Acetobacteraceae bacterium]|nr:MFS transporter [Acetobacteraceae bacterium]
MAVAVKTDYIKSPRIDLGTMSDHVSAADELQRGWPVVLACFGTAVLAWGLGAYGQSVFLAELQRAHGWSASLVGAATTTLFLLGAVALPFVGQAIERFGPRAVLSSGALAMVLGAIGLGRVSTPWQLFACNALMGLGWAGSSSAAIAATLALWFDARRGFAIGLALCGASAGGFVIAPLLVALSARWGFPNAVLVVAGTLGVILLPLILCTVHGESAPRRRGAPSPGADSNKTVIRSQAEGVRSGHVWSLALPFALGIAAQVGFIVHQVAFLLPRLGPARTSAALAAGSIAALGGRLGLAPIMGRLEQRRAGALVFLTQAAGLTLMLAWPDAVAALYLGSILFGLGVGSLILLPALITQREFAPESF